MQARASAQQGTLVARELHKNAYNEALVARYAHLPAIRRIQRNRHLPAPLYKARSRAHFWHCPCSCHMAASNFAVYQSPVIGRPIPDASAVQTAGRIA